MYIGLAVCLSVLVFLSFTLIVRVSVCVRDVLFFIRARVFILSVVLSLVVSGGKHFCQSVDVQIKASSVTRT